MMIVDGKNQIAGRLASNVAKALINGESVTVVNAEQIVISGKHETITREYSTRVKKGDPYHGPFYPKQSDLMFRRMVRGMLPYKKKSGLAKFKMLKVFIGVPEELKGQPMTKFEKTDGNKIKETKLVPLGDISIFLGVKKRW